MKVLIIEGPHAGEVYDMPDGAGHIELINPYERPELGFVPDSDFSLPELTTTLYQIRTVEMRCPGEPDQTYYAGMLPDNHENPAMAFLRFAANRCFNS